MPPLAAGTTGVYTRYLRTAAEHRPLVSVAFVARREGMHCHAPRLVVGASTPVATRLSRAEDLLDGQRVTPERVVQAADLAAEDISPVEDLRGSAAFRREMVRVNVRRTVAELLGLTMEEGVVP